MPETPSPRIDPDQLVQALRYFFGRFALANNLAHADYPAVSPLTFYQWFCGEAHKTQGTRLAAELNISLDTALFVLSLANNPMGPNQIVGVWPYLVLGHRQSATPVRSASVFTVVTFEDGTVGLLSQSTHSSVCKDPVHDADVCHLIITRGPELAKRLMMGTSLDALHAMAQSIHQGVPAGPGEFDQLCHLIMQAVNEHLADLPGKQEKLKQVHSLIGIVRNVICWNVPGESAAPAQPAPPPGSERLN